MADQSSSQITTWLTWVIAVATAVNAIAVVVLVWITREYAASTKRQADAAESQAKAAAAQARAAEAQASAASATLRALRKQDYDQRVMANTVVESGVRTAISNIDFWLRPGPRGSLESSIRSGSLPGAVVLVPPNQSQVLEYSRLLSRQLALDLSRLFDDLNMATQKIETMRSANRDWLKPEDLTKGANEVLEMLRQAKDALQRCQTDLYSRPRQESDAALP
jgi:hypothetical protein